MATRGINFVLDRRRQLSASQSKDMRLFRQSLLVLGLTIMVLVGLLVSRLALSQVTKSVKSEQQRLRGTLTQQSAFEAQYLTFIEKLQLITRLFGERADKQAALSFFKTLFGDSVQIAGLQYEDVSQELTFSIRVPNVFMLDGVFAKLTSEELRQNYPRIEKKNLSRSSDGSYNLQLLVKLGKVGN